MKFRIKKEDGVYIAEYKRFFFWLYIPGSASRYIQTTRDVCKNFERPTVIETFKR